MIGPQPEPANVYSSKATRTQRHHANAHPYSFVDSTMFAASTCHRANSQLSGKAVISISPLSLVCSFLFGTSSDSHQIEKAGNIVHSQHSDHKHNETAPIQAHRPAYHAIHVHHRIVNNIVVLRR